MNNQIFTYIGIALGVVGIIISMMTQIKKIRAERKFASIIRQRKAELLLKQLQEIRNDVVHNKLELSPEGFSEIQQTLKDLTIYLEKDEKKEILESLEQKSLKGQVDYLNKMLHVSGSTESINVKTD